jgi:hypothetical protein
MELHAHHTQKFRLIVAYSFTGSRGFFTGKKEKKLFISEAKIKKPFFAASLNLIVRPREKRGENRCVIV